MYSDIINKNIDIVVKQRIFILRMGIFKIYNFVKKRKYKLMEIIKNQNESTLEIAIVGRLDTTTAPQLDAEISTGLTGITNLVLDFEKLEYVSSAGLRVLLSAQKIMNKQGEMIIRHVNDDIQEVFDITGFADILTIE